MQKTKNEIPSGINLTAGAAEVLGVSVPTIDRYMADGRLTRVRYSTRAVCISADSVHNLMACGAE